MEILSNIFSSFWFEAIIKLVLGFLLAGVIGLERSSWNKPAGFRTHALVGISAVLLMLCGEYLSTEYNTDPSRIPAQLLSGIGFIGAGTILRDGFNVKGLTTAAVLLAVTCIGLSIGCGFYLGGILTTLISYVVLSFSYKFTDKLDHFDELILEICISKNPKETVAYIEKILSQYDVEIKKMNKIPAQDNISKPNEKDPQYDLIRINAFFNKRNFNKNKLISTLSSIKNVAEVSELAKLEN